MSLSTVYPRSDRLCAGCPEPVWLLAFGELEDHPWNQAVWGPLLPLNLPQLQAGWELWLASARSEEPHRSETQSIFDPLLSVCARFFMWVFCDHCLQTEKWSVNQHRRWYVFIINNYFCKNQHLRKLILICVQIFIIPYSWLFASFLCVHFCFYKHAYLFTHHLLGSIFSFYRFKNCKNTVKLGAEVWASGLNHLSTSVSDIVRLSDIKSLTPPVHVLLSQRGMLPKFVPKCLCNVTS